MSAHTPGPWRVDPAGDDRIVAERFCVALVTGGVDDGPDLHGPIFEANARLIATSPMLLKLAHAAHHALMSYVYGNGSPELARSIALALEEVIDEAEGREVQA